MQAISKKSILMIIVGALLLGSAVFFAMMRLKSPLARCVAELGEDDEKIVNEFNASVYSLSGGEAEIGQLRDSLRDYLDCRLVYVSSYSDAEEIWNLVPKIFLPEPMKIQLTEQGSPYYDRHKSWIFRHLSIFYPAEYLCPAGEMRPQMFERCLDFPVLLGLAEKFDSLEVFDSCSNFCSDFLRYSQNPELFFEEEARFENLPSYTASTALKVFLAIRFGGWEEGVRVMKKNQDLARREMAEEIVNSGREVTENFSRTGNRECSPRFRALKESICKIKLR